MVPDMTDVSAGISPVLRNWISKPIPSRGLDRLDLVELNKKFPVHVGRDYRQDLWDLTERT